MHIKKEMKEKRNEERGKLKGGGLMRIRINQELRNEKNKKEREMNTLRKWSNKGKKKLRNESKEEGGRRKKLSKMKHRKVGRWKEIKKEGTEK